MQSASSNFAHAASGGSVTWAKPRVYADWAQDGYGSTSSIDNLSGVAGRISISHVLDDGMPDQVSFVAGVGVAEADVELGAPDGTPPSRYWSVFNSSSPVSGYDRDVAPMKIEHGIVTTDGPEYVRLFTGQMASLPVKTGEASLVAISAARMALTKLLQPPAIFRTYAGLNATWYVSWVLGQCGIYVSPPPQTGTRWWAPLHGGGAGIVGQGQWYGYHFGPDYSYLSVPEWTAGPYVLGADLRMTAAATDILQAELHGPSGLNLADGSDFLSQASSAGRVQWWARGDAADPTLGYGGPYSYLVDFNVATGGTIGVDGGIGTDRKVYVTVNDGVRSLTLKAAVALPTDGEWYFCGFAWDIAANKVWVDFNGTVASSTSSPALTTSGLALTYDLDDVSANAVQHISLFAGIPVAEWSFMAGTQANVDTNPIWANAQTWTPGAVVYPSTLELEAIAERVPREGWEILQSLAQGELATLRTDENDLVLYLPQGYWTQVDQQVVADVVTTDDDIASLGIDYDRSKICNAVRIEYDQVFVDNFFSPLLAFSSVLRLPPGATVLRLALDTPGELSDTAISNLTAVDVDAGGPADLLSNWISVNEDPTGLGAYATAAQVSAEITAWTAGSVEVTVTNHTPVVKYLTNDGSVSYLQVTGVAVHTASTAVTEYEATSIALRGERGLTFRLDAVQRYEDAYRVARRLVLDLCRPVAVVENVKVFGDPRRQPGDLVSLTDEKDTAASGIWRSAQVEHAIDGADYQQALRLRRARLVGTWGVSTWGDCLWGYSE